MMTLIKKLKFRIQNSSRGFTIVEMLLYMGLLSIFLMVLTDLFVNILDVKSEAEATSSVEQDSRYILARLSYEINQATSISQPASIGGSGGTLVMLVGGNTFTYTINGTNLQLSNNLGTNNLNSSGSTVSNLSFQRIGNSGGKDTIKVSYTLNSTTERVGGNEIRTFTTTIGRR